MDNNLKIKSDVLKEYDKALDKLTHMSKVMPEKFRRRQTRFFDTSKVESITKLHNEVSSNVSSIVDRNNPYTGAKEIALSYIRRPKGKVKTYIPNPTLNKIKEGKYIVSIEDSIAIRRKESNIVMPCLEINMERLDIKLKDLIGEVKRIRSGYYPLIKLHRVEVIDDGFEVFEEVMMVPQKEYRTKGVEILLSYKKYLAKLYKGKTDGFHIFFSSKEKQHDYEEALMKSENIAKELVWKYFEKKGYTKKVIRAGVYSDFLKYHKSFKERYGFEFYDSVADISKWNYEGVKYYDNRPLDESGKIIKLQGRVK